MNISSTLEAVKYWRWQRPGNEAKPPHGMNEWICISKMRLFTSDFVHDHNIAWVLKRYWACKRHVFIFHLGEVLLLPSIQQAKDTNKPYCCHCSEAHFVNKCSTNDRSYTLSANEIINMFVNSKLIVMNVCNVQLSTRTSHYGDMNMP